MRKHVFTHLCIAEYCLPKFKPVTRVYDLSYNIILVARGFP